MAATTSPGRPYRAAGPSSMCRPGVIATTGAVHRHGAAGRRDCAGLRTTGAAPVDPSDTVGNRRYGVGRPTRLPAIRAAVRVAEWSLRAAAVRYPGPCSRPGSGFGCVPRPAGPGHHHFRGGFSQAHLLPRRHCVGLQEFIDARLGQPHEFSDLDESNPPFENEASDMGLSRAQGPACLGNREHWFRQFLFSCLPRQTKDEENRALRRRGVAGVLAGTRQRRRTPIAH